MPSREDPEETARWESGKEWTERPGYPDLTSDIEAELAAEEQRQWARRRRRRLI